ncbi:MAG: DUF2079 domain-containing protein, partial [Gaiellaceae bacterium]
KRPYRAVTLALDRSAKVVTLTETFGAWLFLPLPSPLLLVALPSLAERFWSQNPAFWSTQFQYTLPVAPVLAFAAIDGATRFGSRAKPLVVAAVTVGIVLSVAVVRPLEGLAELMPAKRAALTDSCLDLIPPEAPVAASNRLVPHLTHRGHIRRLSRQAGERYLAIALDGPPGEAQLLGQALAGRPVRPAGIRYRLVCRRGDVAVLEAAR